MCLPSPPPRAPRLLAVLTACALQLLCATAALRAQADRPDPVLPVATWRGQQVVAGELLVQFRDGTSAAQQEARHAALGTVRLAAISATLARVALPADGDVDTFVQLYEAVPDVRFAQPNVLHRPVTAAPAALPAPAAPGLVPSDPKWGQQWGLVTVHAPDAWAAYTGAASAVVAVIDSGVDIDHPDLDGHLAWGLDTYAGDGNPDDTNGHGTHCAGIAAAETDNALGVAGAGHACRFASYRCGNSSFPTSALVAAIGDAVAQGALVLSMSWGSNYNDPAIRTALQAARDAGCVLVAAAGNDGVSTKFYPAAHDFVLAVAASTSADARASFSNYGAWVDVAAPGQAIYSTWKGGGYTTMNGTSMACPLVAGLANLLYARLGGARSVGNAALVRAAIEGSATDVGAWVVHGRVDFAAALAALAPPPPPEIASLSPALVPAFHGSTLTLHGSGLLGVTGVTVNGAAPPAFAILDDATLAVTMPDAPALGAATVAVTGAAGLPGSAAFTWVETAPPQLDAAAAAPAGTPFLWSFGGGAGHAWLLLIAVDPAVFLYAGVPILQHHVSLASGVLDARGLGALAVTVPAGAAGITFRSQVVTFSAGFAGASPVSATAITP
jgi:thermitase